MFQYTLYERNPSGSGHNANSASVPDYFISNATVADDSRAAVGVRTYSEYRYDFPCTFQRHHFRNVIFFGYGIDICTVHDFKQLHTRSSLLKLLLFFLIIFSNYFF